jgi:hypothetical protein
MACRRINGVKLCTQPPPLCQRVRVGGEDEGDDDADGEEEKEEKERKMTRWTC